MDWTRVAIAALATLLLAAGPASAGARLDSARWTIGAALNTGSRIGDDGHTITTPLGDRRTGEDVRVAGRLSLDTAGGREIDLSFLTDVHWVTCEAPKGLVADEAGGIDFVCRAKARGLDVQKEPLRVYVKVDPTGGLAHRKLYWILEPGAAQGTGRPARED